MALSYVNYIGDGSTQIFTVPFPYLSTSYISVNVDGAIQENVEWLNDASIRLTTAPPKDALVVIKRTTEKEKTLVDFKNGAVLMEDDLDTQNTQLLHLVQEVNDVPSLLDEYMEKAEEVVDRASGYADDAKEYLESGILSFEQERLEAVASVKAQEAKSIEGVEAQESLSIEAVKAQENTAKSYADIAKQKAEEAEQWAEQAEQQVPNATETTKGILFLATAEEVEQGIDNTKAVTPFTLNEFYPHGKPSERFISIPVYTDPDSGTRYSSVFVCPEDGYIYSVLQTSSGSGMRHEVSRGVFETEEITPSSFRAYCTDGYYAQGVYDSHITVRVYKGEGIEISHNTGLSLNTVNKFIYLEGSEGA